MERAMIDFVDYLGSGIPNSGMLANEMLANGMLTGERIEPSVLQPYIDSKGKRSLTVFIGKKKEDRKNPKMYKKLPAPAPSLQVHATTLRREEWMELDRVIMETMDGRLGAWEDAESMGLTYDLDGMSTTVLEYHDVSDFLSAEMSMSPRNRAKSDRPEYGSVFLPLPIIYSDFDIDARELAIARRNGRSLSGEGIERATRRILEFKEDLLMTDTSYTYGNGTIYSYFSHPDVNPIGFTGGIGWTNGSKTKAQMLADIIAIKQEMVDNRFYGGDIMIYIPSAYEFVLDQDYDVSGSSLMTLRERIMKLGNIKDIKVSDRMPSDTILGVHMTKRTIRLVRGMPIQNVQWQMEGPFLTNHKVLTIQVPQIRSDHEHGCGIVVMS